MKARIKATGEIVDVFDYRYGSKISSENFVVYTDSHGRVHLDSDVDFSEDFEELSEDEAHCTDKWEQRRYEIAKEMMKTVILTDGGANTGTENLAIWCVGCADALIAELKKGGINGSH